MEETRLRCENERLRADNARLREALEFSVEQLREFVGKQDSPCVGCGYYPGDCHGCLEMMALEERAALLSASGVAEED